jgi:hypothetical protein
MHDKLGMGAKWERADRAFGGIEFLESTLCNAFPGVADLEVWKSIHAGPDFLELTLLRPKSVLPAASALSELCCADP